MKRSSALFVQVVIVLLGLGALAFLLWEPHVEGRNAHATVFEIYFQDPFLAYVYLGSTPFFLGLFRAFRLFGQVRETGAFSQGTVEALQAIQRCAIAVLMFVAGGAVFILMFGDKEDRPAGFFLCLLVATAATVVATTAAKCARHLQKSLGRG